MVTRWDRGGTEMGPQVERHELQFDKIIGQGSFAHVWSATWRGTSVAVKAGHPEPGTRDLLRSALLAAHRPKPRAQSRQPKAVSLKP